MEDESSGLSEVYKQQKKRFQSESFTIYALLIFKSWRLSYLLLKKIPLVHFQGRVKDCQDSSEITATSKADGFRRNVSGLFTSISEIDF